MPRPKSPVKTKRSRNADAFSSYLTPGLIDLHFHGAYGIDLMTARSTELQILAQRLGEEGLAGFCATTLSVPAPELREAVERLGRWIRLEEKKNHETTRTRARPALPLGIHLEGPFISRDACGAHPPESIRPLDLRELEQLWKTSLGTLKIITLAPEAIRQKDRASFFRFCQKHGIRPSLGHSQVNESQAAAAFKSGFAGVTHAWNALAFHHRSAGAMGAALGREGISIELIIDQIHVSPTLIRWTLELHKKRGQVCFVSDAAPAAGTSGKHWHDFGPLQIRFEKGTCRLANGHLAGGGQTLPKAYARWITHEAARSLISPRQLLRQTITHVVATPLQILRLSAEHLKERRLKWDFNTSGSPSLEEGQGKIRVSCQPI